MKIEINDNLLDKKNGVTSVMLLRDTAWIDFADRTRIYLSIDQLNGIVEHYERAIHWKETLDKLA